MSRSTKLMGTACVLASALVAGPAAANSLTVHNASSTPYTLKVMTWVAVFFTPLVLLYQGWTYWVFRKRLTVHNASSTPYTLKVMTWVAVFFTPIVLLYQGWTYWIFRKRVSRSRIEKAAASVAH